MLSPRDHPHISGQGEGRTFLNVDMQKLKSKGVESVRSRIENLQTYCGM